jgi:hypothetical protein
LDVPLLGVYYRYDVKIKQKFRHQRKEEFGSGNPQQSNYDKDIHKKNPPKNSSKTLENKGNGKTKKDTRKWYDFQKVPYHNTDECRSKKSLLDEIKEKYLNPDS